MSALSPRPTGASRRRARPWIWILLAVTAPLLASACGGSDRAETTSQGTPPNAAASEPAQAPVGELRLLLGFEEASVGPVEEGTVFTDSSEWANPAVAVYPEATNTPLVVTDDAERGRVMQFPNPCSSVDPQCLRGIIEVGPSAGLDVGDADFSYGAHLKLNASDIRDGANVVQRGYSTGMSGQWKLQVDDEAGRPECVLVGSGTEEAQTVESDRSVADGRWHAVECQRVGQELVLLVDGTIAGRTDTRDRLRISPSTPIRMGAKHVKKGSDPFFGSVDNVFLRIG